jgi:uncharacterized membrane protein
MARGSKEGFFSDFRRFFIRGLATLLPTVLTIVLLVKCFEFVQNNISVYINEGVIRLIVVVTDEYPHITQEDIKYYLSEKKLSSDNTEDEKTLSDIRLAKLREQWSEGFEPLIGFALAIMLVYILGRLLASLFGKKIWQIFESMVQQLPVFKQVYPYVKQVTDFLFGENKIEFTRVVAVPYPSKGIWSIGLVTGAGFRHVSEKVKEDFLTVFIPSSPTPITGYVVYVKKDDVIDLPISIEEALRFTVSGGVIVPGHQALPTQRIELNPNPSATNIENAAESKK